MASTDARPVPLKNVAFRVTFPILDNTGQPVTGAAGLDSEVSIDGAAFSDCTNEATEIGSSGIYYLDLTSGEMNGDTIAVQVKTSTTDANTSVLVFYPQELGDIKVDVQSNAGSAITSASGIQEVKVASIAANAVNASALATDAVDEIQSGLATAAALATVDSNVDQLLVDVAAVPTGNENADALLARSIAGGASSGRIVKQALRAMRNRVDVSSGTTMDVYEEDDTTLSWQLAITTDAAALPIKEIG